ncbi:DNA ligase (NAD(+)) LigA [Candidatus Aerophobetes bacterium]|uniref:DNA ligase n=1 Tax=Aerophobetes bacterium TaxID=2030807 RepID=A0A2A4WYJ6_UNCAE|nr:MAG: DNA ligase (NAD(+)) LigA [Candidatus Aerophobetes bacterium]
MQENKKLYLELVKEIEKHNELYFNKYDPEVSDYVYDQLVKQVESIEKRHPEWIHRDGPTLRVGESVTKGFVSVKHEHPMLSLGNTYSKDQVRDFIKRVKKELEVDQVDFCAEYKIDGVAISLVYEEGRLVRAVTRGNGRVGDDVTENIKTIKALPLHIQSEYVPSKFEIRGEVYLPIKRFEKLNQERFDQGQALFANPRNAAAGSLKLKDKHAVEKREIELICYALITKEKNIEKQSSAHALIKRLGFPTGGKNAFAVCSSEEEIFKYIESVEKQRYSLAFEIDGVVVKVNAFKWQDILGSSAKSPKWAVAYKYAALQAETKILDITVQIGRTGRVTPVAILEPTLLAGSVISRSTLHNIEEIERKDIRIGDTVIIEKGGDVIPKVREVVLSKREGSERQFFMPEHCPVCGSLLEKKEGEVATMCINRKTCAASGERKISFFVSKGAMDIDSLGSEIIRRLLSLGIISSYSDLYRLKKEDLEDLEGFGEKSITNLLNNIEKSKAVTLARFIFALGIPGVGKTTAEAISENIAGIDDLIAFDEIDFLENIYGIGSKVKESVKAYFQDKDHVDEVKSLLILGVKPHQQELRKLVHSFNDKVFVITGTLEGYSRSEAAELIKERGGKTTSSVSKNTDYLLCGEDPGSKLAKAHKLGVEVMSGKQFTSLL